MQHAKAKTPTITTASTAPLGHVSAGAARIVGVTAGIVGVATLAGILGVGRAVTGLTMDRRRHVSKC
jgi:hypothetical protein